MTYGQLVRFWVSFAIVFAGAYYLVGCGGEAAPATCALEGTYEMTSDGCGSSFVWTAAQAWEAPCLEGDVCDTGAPAAFCSFVSAGNGCHVTTTAVLLDTAADSRNP